MTVLTFGLLTVLIGPRTEDASPPARVGIEFSKSIPERDQEPLRDGFRKTVPLACEAAQPCIEGECASDVPTISLAVDGRDRNYSLRWVASDPRIEQPLELDSTCELCSLVEVEQQFATDLRRLCSQLDALDVGAGRLALSSNPARASVRIDGQRVGRTPWSGELNAGDHSVELRARGHRPQRHTVAIVGGVEARRHFTLASNFGVRRRPTWPAWTSLGLGIALSVAGTALITIHGQPWTGRCTGADIDIYGNCRFVHATRPLGIGLAAVGAGAIASGVGLMLWAQRDPSSTIAGIRVGGRF